MDNTLTQILRNEDEKKRRGGGGGGGGGGGERGGRGGDDWKEGRKRGINRQFLKPASFNWAASSPPPPPFMPLSSLLSSGTAVLPDPLNAKLLTQKKNARSKIF